MNSLLDTTSWRPLLEEYDPGISQKQWLELFKDAAIFTESALEMLAEFYVLVEWQLAVS